MHTGRVVAAGIAGVTFVALGAACIDTNAVTVVGTTVETSQNNKTDTVVYAFYDKVTTNVHATFTGKTLPHGSGSSEGQRGCDGQSYVHVVLTGATAHDERGVGTAQGAVYPRQNNLITEVCMIEDYEGYVHYAVGLNTTKAPKIAVFRTGGLMRVSLTKT